MCSKVFTDAPWDTEKRNIESEEMVCVCSKVSMTPGFGMDKNMM